LCLSLLAAALVSAMAAAADGAPAAGRLAGIVTDRQGNPLANAEVLIVGPGITRRVERVMTDVHGRFAANSLAPGRYSLRVAATNLVRNGIEIEPGRSATLSLMLATLLPGIRPPSEQTASRPNDDWKWVLRTSAAVRPVLRYEHALQRAAKSSGFRQDRLEYAQVRRRRRHGGAEIGGGPLV
jgi:hypothetical protein